MYTTIQYEIAKARIADRQRQADRIAVAQGARRGSLGLTPEGRYPGAGLLRRIFIVLAAYWPLAPARSRQPAACHPLAFCSNCA